MSLGELGAADSEKENLEVYGSLTTPKALPPGRLTFPSSILGQVHP